MKYLPLLTTSLLAVSHAHIGAFHKGMFCRNGPNGDNQNTNDIVQPLYQLPKEQWWFHAVNGCDKVPPKAGDWLDLPAGGEFAVEMAGNQGQTTLSFNGQFVSDWPDGGQHPDDYQGNPCITTPNLHTENYDAVAGSAFAISYVSDIKDVTPENLVVFSVNAHSPWKRITKFEVPADLPACPPGGCICAWGWVPRGCGIPNMYHMGYKCRVTGATSNKKLAVAKPPVWCEGESKKCVKGAKQMLYWHQLSGNNIDVSGNEFSGKPKSPAYNYKCGFQDGAQNDIFA